MTTMNVKMVLTGPYSGRDCVLNGHRFEKGVCTLQGDPTALQSVITYLGRSYQAYPEGSEELEQARKRDRENKASRRKKKDGSRNEVQSSAERGQAEPVSGDSGEEHGPSSEEGGVHDGADDDSDAGQAELSPDGDGHEDARVSDESPQESQPQRRPVNEKLRQVVVNLDPEVDDHWTGAGKPAMAAVEEAYGETGITRADVEAAAPGWNRDKAQQEALQNI